jgi:hypothetical protein
MRAHSRCFVVLRRKSLGTPLGRAVVLSQGLGVVVHRLNYYFCYAHRQRPLRERANFIALLWLLPLPPQGPLIRTSVATLLLLLPKPSKVAGVAG